MKLAHFGPLPPLSGAMADFGRELLLALGDHADIELWVDGAQPVPLAATGFRVVRYGRGDPKLVRLTSYDARLYQVNADALSRTPMYDVACRYPGVVILHESAEVHPAGEQPVSVEAVALMDRLLAVSSGLIVRTENTAARVRDSCTGLPVAVIHGCAAREYIQFVERVSGGIEPLRITLVEKVVAELSSMGATPLDTFLIDDFGDAVDRTFGDG